MRALHCICPLNRRKRPFIDYSKVKRDNWFKRDNIRLQSVELIDTDNEVLERRKPVQVRYRVYANEGSQRCRAAFGDA